MTRLAGWGEGCVKQLASSVITQGPARELGGSGHGALPGPSFLSQGGPGIAVAVPSPQQAPRHPEHWADAWQTGLRQPP